MWGRGRAPPRRASLELDFDGQHFVLGYDCEAGMLGTALDFVAAHPSVQGAGCDTPDCVARVLVEAMQTRCPDPEERPAWRWRPLLALALLSLSAALLLLLLLLLLRLRRRRLRRRRLPPTPPQTPTQTQHVPSKPAPRAWGAAARRRKLSRSALPPALGPKKTTPLKRRASARPPPTSPLPNAAVVTAAPGTPEHMEAWRQMWAASALDARDEDKELFQVWYRDIYGGAEGAGSGAGAGAPPEEDRETSCAEARPPREPEFR